MAFILELHSGHNTLTSATLYPICHLNLKTLLQVLHFISILVTIIYHLNSLYNFNIFYE